MTPAVRIALGLGSNMGDRQQHLHSAIEMLAASPLLIAASMRCSDVYPCDALLPEDAPEAWNIPFLNQIVIADLANPIDESSAFALLELCKTIEQRLGRVDRGHWGPREMDVDIIAIQGFALHTARLTIPHPQAHLRDFVMIPLGSLGCGIDLS